MVILEYFYCFLANLDVSRVLLLIAILFFRSKSITDSLEILQYSFYLIKRREPKCSIQNPFCLSQLDSSLNNVSCLVSISLSFSRAVSYFFFKGTEK